MTTILRIINFFKTLFWNKKRPADSSATPKEGISTQQVQFYGSDGQLHKLYAKFTCPENGTEYDRRRLSVTGLSLGQLIPVAECTVGDFHTDVWLQGFYGSFNSVNFDFLDEMGTPVDIYQQKIFQRLY